MTFCRYDNFIIHNLLVACDNHDFATEMEWQTDAYC